ncbi:MAG TPA: FCD domain-containing protein [Burkholderiales bacterium]|nr:FCD domain-containing protein [Burkholderiales bacterium]
MDRARRPRRRKPGEGEHEVRAYLTQAIARGALAPGRKLPTERELAEQFHAPRSAVRKVLTVLEVKGCITRSVGRGTFVADTNTHANDLLSATGLDASPAQIMEVRLLFEPGLADLVVRNATASDFVQFELCLEKAESMRSLEEFELWDSALHQAIAAATHNNLAIRISQMINALRQQAEWGTLKRHSLTPERRLAYQKEHRELVESLKARDSDGARALLVAHLSHVRRSLLGF